MHMSDTLLSAEVGGALWVVTGAAVAYGSRRLGRLQDDRAVPLMGVLGAFIFAAQMINFAIPATGSSGHLAGSMILAILLGPHAAFLTMASVLTVQALFFADGGLLALGANIFNLGILPCYVVYLLIYRPLAGSTWGPARARIAAFIAAVLALQLGAFGVVVETTLSGIAELPFAAFAAVMQPIHLAIGIVEGLITVAVIDFLHKIQPDLLAALPRNRQAGGFPWRNAAVALGIGAALLGGVVAWFASTAPDGLEWSVARVAPGELPERNDGVHGTAAQMQERITLLPDYALRDAPAQAVPPGGETASRAADVGTTLSGLVGGLLTLIMAFGLGWTLRRRTVRSTSADDPIR